jgi:eukaryotic-like serine/threonine-protein kinase
MGTDLQLLGKYELQECLGQGGIAEVWKAFDSQTRRNVVIKIPHADLQNNPDFMTYFWGLPREREAQAILSLQHPNIASIHDFSVSLPLETGNSVPYIVMDYIEGQSLAEYIRNTSNEGAFPPADDLAHFFSSLASAIGYAHQQGIVHGNIKPGKIILDQQIKLQNPIVTPILIDFGIVTLLRISTDALCHWEPDTLYYISPEQVKGQLASVHGDMYALGVILYEMCTGLRPFGSERTQNVLMQQVNTIPPAPSEINSAISPALSAVIMRSIAEDPAERFASTAAMDAALTEALEISTQETLRQAAIPQNMLNGQIDQSPTSSSAQTVSRWSGVPTLPIVSIQFPPKASSAETPLPNNKIPLSPPEQAPVKRSRGPRLRRSHIVLIIVVLIVLVALILGALLIHGHSIHL